jgi:Na+/proline symporter
MEVKDPDTAEPYGVQKDPDTGAEYYLPRADGKATVNGEPMDYSFLDCPWADKLDPDYPAMCLPFQNVLNPLPDIAAVFDVPVTFPQARDTSMYDPAANPNVSLGEFAGKPSPVVCSQATLDATLKHWLPSDCAAPAPGQDSPICKGVIKDCKYSTKDTRQCKSGLCKSNKKMTEESDPNYPDELRFPFPEAYPNAEGECTEEDSAMQWLMCGIPCPMEYPREALSGTLSGLGIVVLVFIIVSALIGFATILKVGKDVKNFFVAGRSLPLFVIVCTLGSQCFDSSSALGNLDLGYAYHWWDGGAFPIGLGASLILNGIFFAKPLNELRVLTLPDVFGLKFGPAAEVITSIVTIISFLFLLAGNLVGCGKILSFLFELSPAAGIVISTALIWAYSAAGGLFSVAYTDVMQAALGWSGFLIGTIWIQNNMPNYAGVSPAYPLGDATVFASGMTDADSYDPIPNAIVLNWATIIVLAFGNLMALDFQARCMAAKTPRVAQLGCLIAGVIAGVIGVVNTFNSGTTRALYGPSSPHAEFVANSCSADITVIGCFGSNGPFPQTCNAVPVPGVPTCGEWKPDPYATLKMLTCSDESCHPFLDLDGSAGYPPGTEGNYPISAFMGGWIIMGIVAASMSTADGAIIAMGTVFSHNIMRKAGGALAEEKNLLTMARVSTLLWAIVACLIASTKPNETGYFLLVAFDVVFAAGVVPLFAAIYWKNCKPIAAVASLLGGGIVRAILEFTLPKDGLLLLAGSFARSFGPGLVYDPKMFDEVVMGGKLPDYCPQENLADWTGVDSLVSPVVSLLFLLIFQFLPIKNPESKWFTPDDSKSNIDDADKVHENS